MTTVRRKPVPREARVPVAMATPEPARPEVRALTVRLPASRLRLSGNPAGGHPSSYESNDDGDQQHAGSAAGDRDGHRAVSGGTDVELDLLVDLAARRVERDVEREDAGGLRRCPHVDGDLTVSGNRLGGPATT